MNHKNLVEQFCTPPEQEASKADKKAFLGKTTLNIEFEDRILRTYEMGTGPNVLLVHGWNSRASHLVLIARYIASSGFRVIIFDGPAHGDSKKLEGKDRSSMFEFGRATACVAHYIGDIYAVIGHSLGAFILPFVTAGIGHFSKHQFSAKKLILISSPMSMLRILENYSRTKNEVALMPKLTQGLEHDFNFEIVDYDLSLTLGVVHSKIMMIHDEDDESMPISDALFLKEKYGKIELKITKGYGHQKILVNRKMLRFIKDFLVS